ncbi:MAG: RluA family pseudouridine synthase [Planctomycetota bacterium]|jgi:23S rRNA pseudouridine1911/1915/1917 synthase
MKEIEILYSDEHLLIVDKPARLLVVQAPGRSSPTLVDLLGKQLGGRVFAVHRLDEDTTGALLLARSEAARERLIELFRERQIERLYLALLAAVPNPPAGRIESYLEEDERGVLRSSSKKAGGQRAVTEYRSLERRGQSALVQCRLETGRRNQIRAHMAELGCPVVGDRKYGYRGDKGRGKGKLLLHAYKLRFEHPFDGSPVEVECLPADAALRP